MKKLLAIALLLAAPLAAAQNFLTVAGSNTYGYGNALLPSGSLIFTATDSHGAPISYQAGGGGQVVRYPTTCSITNGAVAAGCLIANVSVSNPANFCYAVQIVDAANTLVLGGPQSGYNCVQPQAINFWCSAGTCNFDQYIPNIPTALTMLLPLPTAHSIGGVYAFTCGGGQVSNGILATGLSSCVPNGGGGGSTPGGPPLALQYNNSGALGGTSVLGTNGVDTLTGAGNTAVLNGSGISLTALGGAAGYGALALGNAAGGAQLSATGTGNALTLGGLLYNFSLGSLNLQAGMVNPSGGTAYVYGSPLQVGVNGGTGVGAVSAGLNITGSGSFFVGPFTVPSGATLTVASGGSLVCASGATCPSSTAAGTAGQLPYYAANGNALGPDTRLTDNGSSLTYTGSNGMAAGKYASSNPTASMLLQSPVPLALPSPTASLTESTPGADGNWWDSNNGGAFYRRQLASAASPVTGALVAYDSLGHTTPATSSAPALSLYLGSPGSANGLLCFYGATGTGAASCLQSVGSFLNNTTIGVPDFLVNTTLAATTGTLTPGDCADVSTNLTIQDAGRACGSVVNQMVLSAAYTNSTATPTAIFTTQPLAANQVATVECRGLWQAASGGYFGFGMTGPASPVTVTYTFAKTNALSAGAPTVLEYDSPGTGSGYPAGIGETAAGTAATNMAFSIIIGIINGANAGAVAITGVTASGDQLTVEPGSWCKQQ
jgi:hypothetical protein